MRPSRGDKPPKTLLAGAGKACKADFTATPTIPAPRNATNVWMPPAWEAAFLSKVYLTGADPSRWPVYPRGGADADLPFLHFQAAFGATFFPAGQFEPGITGVLLVADFTKLLWRKTFQTGDMRMVSGEKIQGLRRSQSHLETYMLGMTRHCSTTKKRPLQRC